MTPQGMWAKVCSADWQSRARKSGVRGLWRICSRNRETATSSDAELLRPPPKGTFETIAKSKPISEIEKCFINSWTTP